MTQESIQIHLSKAQVEQLHQVIEVGILHVDELIRRAQIYDRPPSLTVTVTDNVATWNRQIWALVLTKVAADTWPPGGEGRSRDGRSRDTKPCDVSWEAIQIEAVRIAIHVALGHIQEACVVDQGIMNGVIETMAGIASIALLLLPHRSSLDGRILELIHQIADQPGGVSGG